MFLRRLGNQCFVLHSFRDGTGQVRHRRLGQWHGADGVRSALAGWSEWKAEIRSHYPDMRVDWASLKARAELIEQQLHESRRKATRDSRSRLYSSLHSLLRQIEHLEDPAVMRDILAQVAGVTHGRLEACGVLEAAGDGWGRGHETAEREFRGVGEADRSEASGATSGDSGELHETTAREFRGIGEADSCEADGGERSQGGAGVVHGLVRGEARDRTDDGDWEVSAAEERGVRVGAASQDEGAVDDEREAREKGGSDDLLDGDEDDEDWQYSSSSSGGEEEDSLEWESEEQTRAEALAAQLDLVEGCLAAGDVQGADESGREALQQASWVLPGRRTRFEPWDSAGALYLRALELLGEVRRRRGLLNEHCRLARLRVEACPDAQALYAYGASLQRAGRWKEALEQYARAPYRAAWRFYLSASVASASGRREEAIDFLLGGLLRDRQVLEDWQRMQAGRRILRSTGFWERFQDLWSSDALALLVAVGENRGVRGRIASSIKEGVLARKLFFRHGRKILSLRVQAVLEGKRFCILTNQVVDLDAPRQQLPVPAGKGGSAA